MKADYPLLQEKQDVQTELVDLYQLTMELSGHCRKEDVLVVSFTSRCNTAGHMAFRHKQGQRVVSSMGAGSMGFVLLSVLGACFASDRHRVVMLEGEVARKGILYMKNIKKCVESIKEFDEEVNSDICVLAQKK